jgi:ABC-2 type transport system permease protein
MKLIQAIRWEWKSILSSPFLKSIILVFFLASVYGLYKGKQVYSHQKEVLERLHAESETQIAEALELYQAGKVSPDDRPWLNIRTPYYAYLIYLQPLVGLSPSPLMVFSVGQAESFPFFKKVSVFSSPYDHDLAPEISNPERISLGSLDFGLMWIYLLPLVLIAYAMRIGSFEREVQLYKLIGTLGNERKWKIQRFAALASFFLILLGLLLVIGWMMGGMQASIPDLAVLGFWALLYLVFWLILLFFLSELKLYQTGQALIFFLAWILFALIIPGAVQQAVALQFPNTLSLEMIDAKRTGRTEIYEQEFEPTKKEILQKHPELDQSLPDSLRTERALEGVYMMAYREYLSEVTHRLDSVQLEKVSRSRAWFPVNPVSFFHHRLSHLAGTDFDAYQQFKDQITQKAEQLHYQIFLQEWEGTVVDEKIFLETRKALKD